MSDLSIELSRTQSLFSDIASAIRFRKEVTYNIQPSLFANEIYSIDNGVDEEKTLANYLVGNLSYVTIPSEITSELKSSCFYNFSSLRYVNLNNANNIPSNCFYSCSYLSEVVGNTQLTNLGANAFYGCSSLRIVPDIFNNLSIIPSSVFIYCSSLSGTINLGQCSMVENYAFYSCHNLSIIASNLISIGTSAFASCYNLDIDLSTLENIGVGAFMNTNVYSLSNLKSQLYIGGLAFFQCQNLSKVYLPNYSTGFNGRTFSGCSNLLEVYSPKANYVGRSEFLGCNKLSKVNVQDAQFIYESAFTNCYNLESIFLQGCSSISNFAFYRCSRLSEIYILAADCSLGNSVFLGTPMSNSSYLGYYGSIYVPSKFLSQYQSSVRWSLYSSRITSLDSTYDTKYVYIKEFFSSNITEIPSEKLNVEYILNEGFRATTSLSSGSYSFPNCLSIGRYGLAGWYSAGTYNRGNRIQVYLPKCSYLNDGAFIYRNLDYISLPECTIIDVHAFAYGYCPQSIVLPKCEYIGSSAFYYCSILTSLYLLSSSVVNIGTSVFNRCSASFYVRASLYNDYINASNWSIYSNRIISMTNEEVEAILNN